MTTIMVIMMNVDMMVSLYYDIIDYTKTATPFTTTNTNTKGRSPFKKTVKKGDIVPFWRPPALNGSKGDICCLITDKSA